MRKVHWRSTARRGHLMVKELEDSPRDELAVVLDAWQGSTRELLDVAVRAAGSILEAYVRRGRRGALVVGGPQVQVQRVGSEGDWRRALELLASVDAEDGQPAVRLLPDASDLLVVSPRLESAFVEALVQRAGRNTALVHVSASAEPRPELLRLQAGGVGVAVARPGDDLQRALSGVVLPELAHA